MYVGQEISWESYLLLWLENSWKGNKSLGKVNFSWRMAGGSLPYGGARRVGGFARPFAAGVEVLYSTLSFPSLRPTLSTPGAGRPREESSGFFVVGNWWENPIAPQGRVTIAFVFLLARAR